jgi:hypothetical protein
MRDCLALRVDCDAIDSAINASGARTDVDHKGQLT